MAGGRRRASEGEALARHVHEFLASYAPTQLTSSESTLDGYRRALALYATFLEGLGVTPSTLSADDFCQGRIESFLAWLADERGNCAHTCNVRLSALSTFLKYVSRHDVALAHLEVEVARVPRRKEDKRHVEGLSKEAVAALMAQPDQSTKVGRRDLALMVYMYSTAARVGEALSTRVGDLTLNGSSPHVDVVGKGRKARTLYLPEKAVEHLEAYLRSSHGAGPDPSHFLFWSRNGGKGVPLSQDAVSKLLKKHARAAHEECPDVPADLHAHQLRHSRASHWLQDGMNIAQVSMLLGHASIETTMVYLDVTIDKEAEAMQALVAVPQEKRWKAGGASLKSFMGLGA